MNNTINNVYFHSKCPTKKFIFLIVYRNNPHSSTDSFWYFTELELKFQKLCLKMSIKKMVIKWLNSRWNKLHIQFFCLEYRNHVVATNLIWLNLTIIVRKKTKYQSKVELLNKIIIKLKPIHIDTHTLVTTTPTNYYSALEWIVNSL